MFRFLLLNIFNKLSLERFVWEVKTNGLLAAIRKTIYFFKRARKNITHEQPFLITQSHVNIPSYFSQLFRQAFKSTQYVTYKKKCNSIPITNIKLIAFYLPQFHPIMENDAWWGKGFTEWTNVTKAIPQFIGHYQPHLPDHLGFYDLRLKSIQHQQIELAKQYGIYGFCYHHYWFNGKKILETPLETVLNSPELDFPFCINWANENWTRRWDGKEHDILIGQCHSPEDDLAFIKDAARYMQDPRYIRIDNKPLLILYRSDLLPDVKATAGRWREWCRENSIGEIFLAITHAFEHINPYEIGFDAAIEFAPNTFPVTSFTEHIMAAGRMVNPDYKGIIFDYNEAVEYGRNLPLPSYRKFRGLFPGWDNEARKPGRGTTFINSSPLKFQQWLSSLFDFTQRNFNPDEQLVFINAWNEWAEGAHLEPDRKFGFGYLEACRIANQLHMLKEQKPSFDAPIKETLKNNIAIVIHAFYLDVFEEILQYMESIDKNSIKVFVTTPDSQVAAVKSLLIKNGFDFTCLGVSNRGRDILPLIKILPEIYQQNFTYLVKVHTKKSTHRADGDLWRNDLYSKLLDGQIMKENIEFIQNHPEIGILAPDGHLVSMSHYLADNAKYITNLAARLGVEMETVMQLPFAAGSMFSARVDALIPLLLLCFDENEFETEQNQVDGTLAHAIERVISVCASRLDYQVTTRSGETIKEDYPHAGQTLSSLPVKNQLV